MVNKKLLVVLIIAVILYLYFRVFDGDIGGIYREHDENSIEEQNTPYSLIRDESLQIKQRSVPEISVNFIDPFLPFSLRKKSSGAPTKERYEKVNVFVPDRKYKLTGIITNAGLFAVLVDTQGISHVVGAGDSLGNSMVLSVTISGVTIQDEQGSYSLTQ